MEKGGLLFSPSSFPSFEDNGCEGVRRHAPPGLCGFLAVSSFMWDILSLFCDFTVVPRLYSSYGRTRSLTVNAEVVSSENCESVYVFFKLPDMYFQVCLGFKTLEK